MRSLLPVLALLAVSCSSASTQAPTPAPAKQYPKDCKGISEADTFDCSEQRFWTAFQQPKVELRKESEEILKHAIASFGTSKDNVALSRAHFRLGQMRLAMSLENDLRDYVLHAHEMIIGEFDEAMRLDPSNGIIAPWKDTMEMAIPAVLGDWDAAVALAERGFANVHKNKMGNTLSLSGTTIGFPLSTGIPQRTVKLLDEWTCTGADFCERNTDHAPWARPGLAFHFAEAYARVGDKAKARSWLDASLSAPGAKEWPFRSIVEKASNDLDGFIKTFSERGNDKGAFDIAYANQSYGCVFCHQK